MARIVSAGNTEVPTYLVLISKGFAVRNESNPTDSEKESWLAEKAGEQFVGDSPLQLLGLVAMHEERGQDWMASDAEVEAFLKTFYPG